MALRHDSDGLINLAIAVMEQAYEDLNYYPKTSSEKTLKEAEKIRKDARDFINLMKERYSD